MANVEFQTGKTAAVQIRGEQGRGFLVNRVPDLNNQRPNRRPINICIASRDLLSWGQPTEVKGSIDGLAQQLAACGENVTLLWVPGKENISNEQEEKLKKRYYERYLVKLEILVRSDELLPILWTPEKQSLAFYHYLKKHEFDAVFIALEGGLAYYSLLAKETGLFDTRPPLIVVGHSPTAWLGEADRYFLKDLEQVTAAHMEKYCAEMADRLVCTSKELRDWMTRRGWKLPDQNPVLPCLTPNEWRLDSSDFIERAAGRQPAEIAVLASPAFRDGLTLFCDSIDQLAQLEVPPLKVTAFGPFGHILGEHTGGMLLRRARRWPFELQIIPHLDYRERLRYLKTKGALACIPSLASATGDLVASCLDSGIPFVATDIGANTGWLSSSTRERCLVKPDPKAISRKLASVLKEPADLTAKMKPAERLDAWGKELDDVFGAKGPVGEIGNQPAEKPLVSVVMVHHDRPQYLKQAISAVEQQSYPNLELILVDDGSEMPESHETLDRLETKFHKKGWKIIRQENKYLGAARNAGVKASKGDLILFVDDDNALFHDAVSKYYQAMNTSKADICTSFQRLFYDEIVPTDENSGFIQYTPLGGSLDLGFIHDSFGDANAMIRRSVFEQIGYQIEDYGYTAQDWEFYARATLAGLKLRVIPEPLYWYRSKVEGMYRTSHWYSNRLPILNAFRKHNFKGLEHVYHLVLANNVSRSEVEGYRENLTYSVSDERYIDLCDLDPNSPEAMETLAEIAAAEGRPDTALVILGNTHSSEFRERVMERLSAKPLVENALQETAVAFIADRPLSSRDLAGLEVSTDSPSARPPLTYVEKPDRFFLQAEGNHLSLAVLSAGCPASTVGVSASVSLDQAITEPAEFLVLLSPQNLDPALAVRNAPDEWSEGCSGWCGIAHPFESRKLEAMLYRPSTEHMNLILAVRTRKADSKPVLGCFSGITTHLALGDRAVRRPRIGPPPTRLRAREWTAGERGSVKLVTDYPSQLPLLLIGPGNEGIFLRPHKSGPVVASIECGFPPFARRLIAKVEIAHEEASPFEFAVALTRPTEPVIWTGERPVECRAFSGWLRVEETFKLHDLETEVRELAKMHHTINLAIRLPRGSSPSPANAFWRKMVFLWDE